MICTAESWEMADINYLKLGELNRVHAVKRGCEVGRPPAINFNLNYICL